VKTKKPRSRPKTGSAVVKGCALRKARMISQCTLARRPEITAITVSTMGKKRRMSGSITTRPGRPSWSSSSHSTSGAAVRAANVRLVPQEQQHAQRDGREEAACSDSVVQKTPV